MCGQFLENRTACSDGGYTVMARTTLSTQWRCALEMLADAGGTGLPVATLLANGFSTEMLQSLEMVGLAARFGPQRTQMGQVHITETGRRALGPRNTPVPDPAAPQAASVPEETAMRTVGSTDGTTRS